MSKSKISNLTFKFSSSKARHQFWVWLCEQGEQDYWNWMEHREQELTDLDLTALQFEYEEADSGTIRTQCGRLDGRKSK